MDKKNSYQQTLNLPKTDFSIRANAVTKEAEILEFWEKIQLHEKTFQLNKDNPSYILHDGPPYANGNTHMGHALNKILKDIVCKLKRMQGRYTPLTPGWDCHGLPIELKVAALLKERKNKEGLDSPNTEKENKESNVKKELTPEERVSFKKECRSFASGWIDKQRKQFIDMGVLADWKNPYITMDKSYEADILRSLATFIKKGCIERKGKTVPWCFSCKTVLANAEIEHQDRKDPSVYVALPLEDKTSREVLPFLIEHQPSLQISMLIWTTTPWTLPLNRAVVIHPTETYVVIKGKEEGQAYVVGKKLAETVCKELEIPLEELAELDPPALQGREACHPITEGRKVPIILDKSVEMTSGTACVHSAPGCGPEDYLIGIKNNLEIYSPLSDDGRYTSKVEQDYLEGVAITDGQWVVLKELAKRGTLAGKKSIRHSYPHCWRCKNGLMFRATDQWFCSLSAEGLIDRTRKEIENITFHPSWGKARLDAFVSTRSEWCISRQRIWGVPIPALLYRDEKDASCSFTSAEFVGWVADHVQREGIEFWDTVSLEKITASGLIPQEVLQAKGLTKERDILDVWFDSGVSHEAVLRRNKNLSFPADLYLEGSDQHRGWFQSSLFCSMVLNGKSQAKEILTHGFIVDQERTKMSKSLGNGIEPHEVVGQYSRDILRLWVASTDFEKDVVLSHTALKNVSDVYRKIRNTCRFLLSNLYDFDPQKDSVDVKEMLSIDRYILSQLSEVSGRILSCYNDFKFAQATAELNNFCVHNLSGMYLDISKDRLYVAGSKSKGRRSAQTAMMLILDSMSKLMAPILSFLAEEIHSHLGYSSTSSVHLLTFAELSSICTENLKTLPGNALELGSLTDSLKIFNQQSKLIDWDLLHEIRQEALRVIEQLRAAGVVKHSLESAVKIEILKGHPEAERLFSLLADIAQHEDVERFMADWFIVSQFEMVTVEKLLSPLEGSKEMDNSSISLGDSKEEKVNSSLPLGGSKEGRTNSSLPLGRSKEGTALKREARGKEEFKDKKSETLSSLWFTIKASHASGNKCLRCWKWQERVVEGQDGEAPQLCTRCSGLVSMPQALSL